MRNQYGENTQRAIFYSYGKSISSTVPILLETKKISNTLNIFKKTAVKCDFGRAANPAKSVVSKFQQKILKTHEIRHPPVGWGGAR